VGSAHHPALRAVPLLLALLLAGCRGCTSTRPPIHLNPNMDDQPKVKAQAESDFFYDGAAMRTPVEDTVPLGGLHEDAAFWTGKASGGAWVDALPVHADATLLARGEQRFGIYCGPCHGQEADGKGMLFQRAQVQSANLLEARFRAMPVGQLFDEVTHGVGLMPAYGPFVPAADRWAILAYLRKLQAETPEPEAPAEAAAAPVASAAAAGPAAAPAAAVSPGGTR
jgi:mono/diheme cytochrome c family protein